MYHLNSLRLRNYLLYDSVDFNFEEGITRIGGANRTGKSLLFSGLPSLLAGKQYGVLPKKSTIELDLTVDHTKTPVEHSWGVKNGKHLITKNGKDMQPHTIKDARALIDKYFHIDPNLLLSSVFLSNLRQHPLNAGTPSTRAEWLASVLDITTAYDPYLLKAEALHARAKEARTKVSVLEEQLLDHPLPQEPCSKAKYKQALVDSKRLTKQLTKLNTVDTDEIERLQDWLTLRKKYPELFVSSKSIIDDLTAQLKRSRKALASAEREAEEFDRLKSRWSQLTKVVEAYNKTGILDKELNKATYSKWKKRLEISQDNLEQEEIAYKEKSAALWQSYIAIVSEASDLEKLLVDLNGKDTYVCSACDSVVDMTHATKRLKILKPKVQQYNKIKSNEARIHEDRMAVFTTRFELAQKWVDDLKSAKALKSRIKELQSDLPKNFDPNRKRSQGSNHVAKLENEVDQLEDKLLQLKEAKSRLKSLKVSTTVKEAESRIKSLKKASKSTRQRYAQVTKDLELASSLVSKYNSYKDVRKSLKSTRSRLNDKIAEMREQSNQLEPSAALVKSFSNSGLRLIQLQESATAFSQKLSQFSAVVFDDTYTFNIEVKPRKLDVIIDRKGLSGGLNTLSGSESRMWPLLCALAFIHILPSGKRSNTIFLDEMEANLDQRTRDRYSLDFVPEIQQIVPQVVLITPMVSGEMKLQPDHDYRVETSETRGVTTSTIRKV